MDLLLSALEKNITSAAFVILDATVNPDIPGAESSRAGLFLRNTEPNALNRSAPSVHYMRGPIVIARERSMYVLPQRAMEFTVEEGDFFYRTMEGAKDADISVSRLYYWSPKATLAGDYDEAIILCVPVITADGTVAIICGLEVSHMLFKMQNIPDDSVFIHAFSMVAPAGAETINTEGALFASSFSIAQEMSSLMRVSEWKNRMSLFETEAGGRYISLSRNFGMYPKAAVHGSDRWVFALMVPEGDLNAYISDKNMGLLALMTALFLADIVLSIFLSHRYLIPV
ncbi:MAG: hypothetical protein LBS19_04975 [Clostridiales bacterium]|jgi:hypothetical protein|nr:hypothetical protein [Clostridiales bacterium]